MGGFASGGEYRMSEYIIRMMQQEDVAQVEAIEREAYKSPWSQFAYKEELADNGMAFYLVLCEKEREDVVIGYGGFWKVLDEGHITKVTISCKYRGQGLSKILLQGMLELEKSLGIQRSTLEVRVSNEKAIGLYKKLGFSDSGIRPKYYADGEDALIMWRELDDVVVSGNE